MSDATAIFRRNQKPVQSDDVLAMLKYRRSIDAVALENKARDYSKVRTRSRLQRLAGTSLEREYLVNDELKRSMLGPEKYQPSAEAKDSKFSPLGTMLNDMDLGKREHALNMHLMQHSITMSDWADEGMASVVSELAGKPWEEVYAIMRREIYRSVMAHEVGHTLGLRHNFEASMDALNYNPKFWDSYDKNTEQVLHKDANGNPTTAERFMYSSIMDYDARFYADSLEGIGAYDVAAIKFGYGNLVEVFEPSVPALYYENMLFLHDYTKIPKILSGENACPLTSDLIVNNNVSQCKALNSLNRMGELTYLKDGLIGATPKPENIWKRTHATLDELSEQTSIYYNEDKKNFPEGGKAFALYTEVPYKFCSDEWAGSSNVSCQPYDKGANFREITADRMQRYNSYYFFTNFKRDRFTFDDYDYAYDYMNRLISRYFSQMSNVYRYYLYGFQSLGSDARGTSLTLNDFDVGQNWTQAAMDGLNYLTAILEQPEPGSYCLDATSNTYRMLKNQSCANPLEVPVGIGKYYYTQWTDEYYYKATVLGTFYDKYAALWALTDNEGYFYQNFSDTLDEGSFALSYWRGLNNEMLKVFDGAYTGKTSPYALGVLQTGNEPQFLAPPVVDVYNNNIDYAALPKIESATSWTLRYYSMALSMARFNSMYDYTEDFAHFSRVCLDGYKDCLAFGHTEVQPGGEVVVLDGREGVDYTSFIDPTTGYRYIAALTPSNSQAIGAQLLAQTKTFVENYYEPAFDAWQTAQADYDDAVTNHATAEVLTEKQNALSSSELLLGTVERQLHEQTSMLDILRQLADTMEYGG